MLLPPFFQTINNKRKVHKNHLNNKTTKYSFRFYIILSKVLNSMELLKAIIKMLFFLLFFIVVANYLFEEKNVQ